MNKRKRSPDPAPDYKTFYHICTKVDEVGIHCLCGRTIVSTAEDEDNISDYAEQWVARQNNSHDSFWEYYQNCQACAQHPDYALVVLGSM